MDQSTALEMLNITFYKCAITQTSVSKEVSKKLKDVSADPQRLKN